MDEPQNLKPEITGFECELARLKYESELRREDSVIQQSGHMQTAFSFSTAALFMVAPIVIEFRGELTLELFLVAFSSITLALLFSLLAATVAQERKKQHLFPNAYDLFSYIEANESKLLSEEQRNKYLSQTYAVIQKSLTENTNKRVLWVQRSMRAFYIALGLSVFWFIVVICKML